MPTVSLPHVPAAGAGTATGAATGGARRRTVWTVTALAALAPATWGTTYAVTTEWLPPDRPLLAAAARALPAGLLLVVLGRQLPRGAWWWKAATLGALNIGAFFALLFVAAYRLPGGIAAVLGAAQPLIVALLALPLLGRRPRARTLWLGLAGVAGVALIVVDDGARLDAVGVLAGLAGTASMATGVVLTQRWGRPAPLLAFTGWQLLAGGLLLLPVLLLVEGLPSGVTGGELGGFAYLGLVNTALAYALWLRGLDLLPAERISFLTLLSPVVAAAIGWGLLGQALTPVQLGGAAVALGSLVLAQRLPAPSRHGSHRA
ncbi:EamA family transporter [Blastococcus xanthinilyticus]|uniref:Putative blue pigment (Indigoidine) exporter n=1 Tax=Blastococcus xanthinilyticus TaxID=1564164 RepID=A0A5S5CT25_9ACTN|nr:EamA family transporter [Blastococcus xanthinilyticus]TYP86264.1 putative blue pigment (indigoidine) exporter [Blastococcus xanthinilyticus]